MTKDWVYVGGTFDMFHYGHMNFLRECQKYGPVIVSLNTDDFANTSTTFVLTSVTKTQG
jgi:cytidyltransferase-like protein